MSSGPEGVTSPRSRRTVGEFSRGQGQTGSGAPQAEGSGKNVVISRVRVEKPTLNVSAVGLQGKTASVTLSDMELKDIGKGG